MHTHLYQVTALKALAENITQFHLEPVGGAIDLLPGQYVSLEYNNQSIPFSVAGFQDKTLIFHIKHGDANPLATEILSMLELKQTVTIKGPEGKCVLPNQDAPLIFIAGGTGIAPHKAMLDALILNGHHTQVVLWWGIRNLKDYYLKIWFESLSSHSWLEHHLVVSEQDNNWDGKTGLVHQAFLDSHHLPTGAIVYASGPYPMVTALQTNLQNADCTLLSDMIS